MYLYRFEGGRWAFAAEDGGSLVPLEAGAENPWALPPRSVAGEPSPPRRPLERAAHLAPVVPGKIVGVGRNYRAHAAELDNPMPEEPLLFLKAPTALLGHGAAIELPPESSRVEFEGEIALVVGQRLRRANPEAALAGIRGLAAACDVTARDLQRRDATFARGKSFDTFCPLGPGVRLLDGLGAGGKAKLLGGLEVITRVNGEERQRGCVAEMEWGPVELLVYISRMMTLLPGDLILTGTPAGVGPLAPGDRLEVEVPGVGLLANPVREAVLPAAAPEG